MRIVELPFDVDPVMARATLQSGTLQVVLPRSDGRVFSANQISRRSCMPRSTVSD